MFEKKGTFMDEAQLLKEADELLRSADIYLRGLVAPDEKNMDNVLSGVRHLAERVGRLQFFIAAILETMRQKGVHR